MTWVTPKDTVQIQNALVTFLEDNLVDPYEQRSGNTRTDFVTREDKKVSFNTPTIQIVLGDLNPQRITSQGKVQYLEEEEHLIMIYYFNKKEQQFTFPDTSLKLKNEAQSFKYLNYIRNTLKTGMASFDGVFYKHVFGSIAKPQWNPASNSYIGSLPFTVFTYRRTS